jgi:hydroxymethylglutaryl-CoA reductase
LQVFLNYLRRKKLIGLQKKLRILNSDEKNSKLHDEFIENTITNFYIPLGVAPNFLINGKYSTIPIIEVL